MASRKRTNFRKLNPAFAAAHGLATKDNEEDNVVTVTVAAPSSKASQRANTTGTMHENKEDVAPSQKASFSSHRLEQIRKQARSTGKLNGSNAGLTHPLPDALFDLRVPVDLSMQSSSINSSYCHTEEMLVSIDLSDNFMLCMDERLSRFQQAQSFRFKRAGFESMTLDISGLEHLRILDLSGNKLQSLDLNLLPPGLAELHLQSNQLQTLTSSSASFSQLSLLDVSDNRLTSLDDVMCYSLSKLGTFRCQTNQLTTLPSFLDVCRDTLQVLDASHNQIFHDQLDFSKFTKLHYLNLGFNKLENTPSIGGALQRLDLNSNKLTTLAGLLPQDESSSLASLALVDLLLQDNYIEDLTVKVVEQLKLVQRLDLSYNKLKSLPYQLGFLPQLQSVRLSGNPLLTFKASDIDNTRAILQVLRNRAPKGKTADGDSKKPSLLASGMLQRHTLNLAGRKPAPLDLNVLVKELRESPQQAFDISGRLSFDGNKLAAIPEQLFPLLPNASEVSICDNLLTELPASLGSSCHRLTKLNLARNRLVHLHGITSSLPPSWSGSLLRLDLSVNRLTEFPLTLLRHLVQLDTLNLSSNRLQSVSDWDWLPASLSVLDLSENNIDNVDSLVIVLGACCPMLQSLSLASNDIRKLPYTIGLLSKDKIKHLDLKGNPQQSIRHEILQKTATDQLQYLYNRMTREQREEAQGNITSLAQSHNNGGTSTATNDNTKVEAPPPILVQETTRRSAQSASETAPSNSTRPPANPVSTSADFTTSSTESNTEMSASTEPAEPSEKQAEEEPKETDLMIELKRQIQEFEVELDKPSLTHAKRYAVKKSLAMARSKLIREERRLGLRK